jgi:uncharacterized GH25 family protein
LSIYSKRTTWIQLLCLTAPVLFLLWDFNASRNYAYGEISSNNKKVISVGGFVQDENAKPVQGANVVARIGNKKYLSKTDNNGKWKCEIPAETINVSLEVTHPDYVLNLTTNFGTPVNKLEASNYITVIKKGYPVSGRVTDLNELPVEGATVFLGNVFGFSTRTKTDSDGKFGFAATKAGEAVLMVRAGGHSPDSKKIDVCPDAPEVKFKLGPGHTIRGRIVDRTDKPVKGMKLVALEWRGYVLGWEIKTDEQGRFEWHDAPADDITFAVFSEEHGQVLTIAIGPSDKEQVIEVYKPLFVSGNVVDADSNKAVERFNLVPGEKYGEDENDVSWDQNKRVEFNDGQYKLELNKNKDGSAVFRIEADGYTSIVSRVLTGEEDNVVLNFTLQKNTGITSKVLLANGTPAQGAEVVVCIKDFYARVLNGKMQRDNPFTLSTKTDSEGLFSLPPQASQFTLSVTHEGGYAVIRGEEVNNLDKIVLTQWGKIEGEVYYIGHQRAGRKEIVLNRFVPDCNLDSEPPVTYICSATTDDNGKFLLEKVPAGLFKVQYIIGNVPVTVKSGSFAVVEVKPGQTSKAIVGGTGRPIIGQVKVVSQTNEPIRWGQNIIYQFGSETSAPEYDPNLTQIENMSLRKTWSGSVKGQIEERNSWEKIRSYPVFVNNDGTFRVEDVIPGTYTLYLSANDRNIDYQTTFEVPEMNIVYSNEPLNLGIIEINSYPYLKVGDKAEPFEFVDANGRTFSLNDFKGKVVFLNFCDADVYNSDYLKELFNNLNYIYEIFRQDSRFALIFIPFGKESEDFRKAIESQEIPYITGYIKEPMSITIVNVLYRMHKGGYHAFLIGPDAKILAETDGSFDTGSYFESALYKALE